MAKIAVTIEIDESQLRNYADEHLATLWRVAQANPAPLSDRFAGEIAEAVGREIIRRWLRAAPVEMYRHQGRHYYWNWLTKFAKYVPGGGMSGSPEWKQGEWVPKDQATTCGPAVVSLEAIAADGAVGA